MAENFLVELKGVSEVVFRRVAFLRAEVMAVLVGEVERETRGRRALFMVFSWVLSRISRELKEMVPVVKVPVLSRRRVETLARVSTAGSCWIRTFWRIRVTMARRKAREVRRTRPSGIMPTIMVEVRTMILSTNIIWVHGRCKVCGCKLYSRKLWKIRIKTRNTTKTAKQYNRYPLPIVH